MRFVYYGFIGAVAIAVLYLAVRLIAHVLTHKLREELREFEERYDRLESENTDLQAAEPTKIKKLREANNAHQRLLDEIMAELVKPDSASVLDLNTQSERIANLIRVRRPDHI
jgi:uncharacterized protein YoxC